MRLRIRLLGLASIVLLPALLLGAETPGKPAISAEKVIPNLHVDLAAGKMVALWTALPPSYQKDLKSLVSDAAAKVDPDVFAKSVAVLRKAVKLLKDKKEFVLTNPALANIPLADPKKLPQFYDAALAVLDTLANSELTRLDDLKKADIEKFLAGTGSTLFKQSKVAEDFLAVEFPDSPARSMVRMNERFKKFPPTLEKSDDKEATVVQKDTLFTPPSVTKFFFVNVEGKWIDKDLANHWSDAMKSAKAAVAQGTTKEATAATLKVIGQIDQALDALMKAKTAEAFHQETATQLKLIFSGN
jgi:hypothetical protein